ncbi:hypothetical protein J5N97_006020 [Dioscorea zingiberensis]|uniref:Uncharacterized protein n=1 Tax=Dioscorea zingiberensis TaxID=325984 RepID=A0A9D5HT09_9LILI|nr:hypothetical protein J5N97_006020 [Dioscorea zingiberensis]
MPGSNWLERLRRSKGLPTSDLDLDAFISSLPNPNPNPDPVQPPAPPAKPGCGNPQVFDLMSSVLSELFVMNAPAATVAEKPKSSRKQRNPKLCSRLDSASASGARAVARAPATSPSSAENSLAGVKKGRPAKPRRKRGPASSDFGAYSRTEVTVIDTSSSPGWKSEKIIFSKGLVWKVRDKKLWNFNRKKRKLGIVDKLGGEKEKEKDRQSLGEVKAKAQKETLASLEEECVHKDNCTHTDNRDTTRGTQDQVPIPKKRPKFSRSPRIPAAKDSSIFRIKVLTSKKNGTTSTKNTLKGK